MKYRVDNDETVAQAVVDGVCAAKDCEHTTLRPLEETVNTDALNEMFDGVNAQLCVSFEYSDCHVYIQDGSVSVEQPVS